MDADKERLIERMRAVGERMSSQMRGSQMEEWSEIDLTMPQLRALGYLGEGTPRMSDIAAFLGSSVSSATSLIERLVGKGLVARTHDPLDRRVVMCALTDNGREAMERIWRMQRLKLEQFAEVLTIEELARVTEAMELLSSALERHNAAAPDVKDECAADLALTAS